MMRALSPDFNRIALELAPRNFVARGDAPSTFAELMRAPSLVVSDTYSLATIYGDARVNHAFRAWHDATHRAGQYDFTLEGERATRQDQWAQILRRYPCAPAEWHHILYAEIDAQVEHATRTGEFPSDQATFVRTILGS